MSERKEVNKMKFWTPLRIACTVISLGLLAAFGVSSCNSNDPPYNANRNTAAPTRPNAGLTSLPRPILDAENKSANGSPIKLADYSGKVMLVNLWATWCQPCRIETPELVKLHTEYQSRGVEMIGLSTEDPDASAESVAEFVKEYNVKYHIGWATRDVAIALMQGRTNIPQSFIIGRDGRIVKRFIGFRPDATPQQIKQALEEALKS
ncbi:MAG TPA: TlpA disulfide reductase family protein [Pyrinomonadaceae bacterium]